MTTVSRSRRRSPMAGTPALSAAFVVLAVIAAIAWMLNGAPALPGTAVERPASSTSSRTDAGAQSSAGAQADGAASSTAADPSAPGTAGSVTAPALDTPLLAQIAALPVVATVAVAGYERAQFGDGWKDPDRNGCDARNDILARDLTAVTFKPGTRDCVVATGVLKDPYTATTIDFVRGNGTSEAVQIDHIVPLSWAWQHGAAGWTADQRLAFANDPLNLLAVDGPTNASKSDSGPADWLPPSAAYSCAYADRFADVLTTYAMGIDDQDRAALVAVAQTCA